MEHVRTHSEIPCMSGMYYGTCSHTFGDSMHVRYVLWNMFAHIRRFHACQVCIMEHVRTHSEIPCTPGMYYGTCSHTFGDSIHARYVLWNMFAHIRRFNTRQV